ncbi:MAG: hypothetical protein QW177_09390, partial [Candidatus Nitrosotenuis sp.]
CVGSAKTRLMATDETEKQQKQKPEPFRVGSVSAKKGRTPLLQKTWIRTTSPNLYAKDLNTENAPAGI